MHGRHGESVGVGARQAAATAASFRSAEARRICAQIRRAVGINGAALATTLCTHRTGPRFLEFGGGDARGKGGGTPGKAVAIPARFVQAESGFGPSTAGEELASRERGEPYS